MTASNVKFTNVTAVQTEGSIVADKVRSSIKLWEGSGAVATTSIDEIGDSITVLSLPSTANVKSLKLFNTDLDSNGTPLLAVNVGLARGEGTDGTLGEVLDADAFASAITTLQAENLVGVEILHESGVVSLVENNDELWEIAGLSEDCGGHIDIVITATAAAATAAAGSIKVQALVAL